MWIRKFYIAVLSVSLSAMTATAEAAPIAVSEFSGSETVTTFNGLFLPVFDNPAPVVFDGNTYDTNDNLFRYSNFDGVPVGGDPDEKIGTNTEFGFIDIVLGNGAQRAGIEVGFLFQEDAFSVEFFDLLDNSLFLVNETSLALGFTFVGFEADAGLIGRVRITDTSNNISTMAVDNFRFEGPAVNVPEPLTLALFGLGLAGLGFTGRRKPALMTS